jgi:hypothetical protein
MANCSEPGTGQYFSHPARIESAGLIKKLPHFNKDSHKRMKIIVNVSLRSDK